MPDGGGGVAGNKIPHALHVLQPEQVINRNHAIPVGYVPCLRSENMIGAIGSSRAVNMVKRFINPAKAHVGIAKATGNMAQVAATGTGVMVGGQETPHRVAQYGE